MTVPEVETFGKGSSQLQERYLEVLFSPVEFAALTQLDLSATTCVVFDVLRATSTMAVALSNGAKAILPVASISEALTIRSQRPDVLLVGERDGVRIPLDLTGGIAFCLGNSPREFTSEIVSGKTIVMTTTNGTRAFRAAVHASRVLVASFLNLAATAERLIKDAPAKILLVCAGTKDEPAYEDALCAGALCELLWSRWCTQGCSDSALMARKLFCQERHDLLAAISQSRNGQRLLSLPELRNDVQYCVQPNLLDFVLERDKAGEVVLADLHI
ncbi:MAG TPA: 2-phosphosulfolactate phosphatase [Terrimicrobiaceae bacterium]